MDFCSFPVYQEYFRLCTDYLFLKNLFFQKKKGFKLRRVFSVCIMIIVREKSTINETPSKLDSRFFLALAVTLEKISQEVGATDAGECKEKYLHFSRLNRALMTKVFFITSYSNKNDKN